MVAIWAFHGKPVVDTCRWGAPLASRTGTNGGLTVLTAVFLVIRAQVSQDHPPGTDHRSGHAGAGGARSRVMRARICPNIRPDTATSAIWNVT